MNTAWALLTLMAGHCKDRECVARYVHSSVPPWLCPVCRALVPY